MAGEPNSFVRGTLDRFGATFGVPLTKHERIKAKKAVEFAKSDLGREKASLRVRLKHQPVTTPYPLEPEQTSSIDLTPILAAHNKLIGARSQYPGNKIPRDLSDALRILKHFLERHDVTSSKP